jgi:hypothetical protein
MKKSNGDGNLQAAIALLVQNQAALGVQHTTFLSQMSEINERSDRRFARIEADLEEIKASLVRHEQTLCELPEAIRQKIGYKPK